MSECRISSEDVSFYRANGYLVARGFFEESHLNDVLKKFSLILRPGGDESENLFEILLGMKHDKDRYLGRVKAIGRSLEAHDLLLSDRTLEATRELGVSSPSFCTSPVTHICSEELRLGDDYARSNMYHQDWPSIQGSLNSIIVWIPMFDIVNNYPIYAVPGSHLEGVITANDFGNGFPEIKLSKSLRERSRPLRFKKGDVLFFSSFLIHGTGTASDGHSGFRLAISGRFDDMDDKFFIKNNYYCAYKRYVDRDVHNSPSKDDIRRSILGGIYDGRFDVK
jgi:hypothetical protein